LNQQIQVTLKHSGKPFGDISMSFNPKDEIVTSCMEGRQSLLRGLPDNQQS
jgi:hypothetical protein